MKLSYNWLNDYVNISDLSAKEVAEKLTMHTSEVDSITEIGAGLDKIITAKILKIEQHPNADKLTLVTIDTGSDKPKVVCGAKNIKEGQIVPFIREGLSLPDGTKIKKTKIRGVESCGMICSGVELGISEDATGILILDDKTKVGLSFGQEFGLTDYIFEIENKNITNRPDLWGHVGISREFSAILGRKLKPVYNVADKKIPTQGKTNASIKVLDTELCPRYSAICLSDIKIMPSPLWLVNRLNAVGIRAINNVVDVTNYVLMEFGQPTHAFDLDTIPNNTIIVRRAKEGEKIKTLDDIERKLTKEDLLICDNNHPIALAGVMGGQETEINDKTTNVLIESANFHAINVRKTSARFGLRTESSIRFEKGLDPKLTILAVHRIVELLKQFDPNVKVVSEIIDEYGKKAKELSVPVSMKGLQERLGFDIKTNEAMDYLKKLEFEPIKKSDDLYNIKVPSFRATGDIEIEEDVIEEVGRLFGYNNIKFSPPKVSMEYIPCQTDLLLEKNIKTVMSLALGYNEIRTYSFTNVDEIGKIGLRQGDHIELANPITTEQTHLRTTLISEMLKVVYRNLRNYTEFRLYEFGRIYKNDKRTEENLPNEQKILCGCICGKDFHELKSGLDELINKLELPEVILKDKPAEEFWHPGKSALVYVGDKRVGEIGEIHPATLIKFDIKTNVFIFNLYIKDLLELKKITKEFKELPKYPGTKFDVSILAPKRTFSAEIIDVIRKTNQKFIKDVELFDVYEGKNIPEDKKSISFGIEIRSDDKTLEEKEIKKVQNAILDSLNEKGFKLREK